MPPRLPGESRRRIPEFVLTALVLAALINVVVRFVVDGKLPQPFIFDINDTFMDWFNTAQWAHNRGAFDVWRTVYPPISFVFLRLFGLPQCYLFDPVSGRNCDYVGIATIIACYVFGAIVAYVAFRRNDPRTAIFRGLSFGLGLPWLFTLERGNLILPCFIFFVAAHSDIVRRPWMRAVAAAVTINFKPYLLLPVLAYAFKRQWRFLELAGIATVLVYLLTFAALGAGSPAEIFANTLNWLQFTNGLVWEQVYYSTSYAPFMEFNTHRFPTRDFLPSTLVEPLFVGIPILITTARLVGLAALIGAFLQPGAVPRTRISVLLLATSLVASSPGGYTEVFLVFLLFMERWQRPGPIVALFMGYLLCIPYDYVISNFITMRGTAWLSGRSVEAPFGISVGMFLRPGLIIIMLWALALDTIALVARAHRTSRPTLDLHPRTLFGRRAAAG